MTVLSRSGIGVDVPPGWDGRLRWREERAAAPDDVAVADASAAAAGGDATLATLQLATFTLPVVVGDFGGGAVEMMRPTDIFVSLLEFPREDATKALFAAQPRPKKLTIDELTPDKLHRRLARHAGAQRFFNDAGRAFCLYVVVGDHLRRWRLVPRVNDVLRSITIDG
jgi:hypothetical protein